MKKEEQKGKSCTEQEKGQKQEAKPKADKASEFKEQLQRLQAEYENYIKRNKREKKAFEERANEEVLLRVIDVYDDIMRALPALEPGSRDGVVMIAKNMKKLLDDYGVKHIEAVGKPFDPHVHEALLTEKTTAHKEDTILEELQRGYVMHGRVIRHAKVKIAKGE